MCTSTSPESPRSRAAELRLALLERERRLVEARITNLLAEVDRDHLYRDDGHLTARAWAMATTNWSVAETTARLRTARACAELPAVNDAFASGELGVSQAHAFGRAHANPRVTAALPLAEAPLLEDALELTFDEFNRRIRVWTELADADGTHRSHEGAECMRHARLTDVGTETLLSASFGTAQGAIMREILEAFRATEFAADLEASGPTAPLPRSDSQRSADALFAIFLAAAEGGHGGTLDLVVNLVIDQETFEEQVRQAAGAPPAPRDPASYRSRRCETMDGTALDPADVLAASLIGSIRRVVVDSASVVIDLGRKRCFTGAARHALLLRDRRCVYAGCGVPARHAEGDHLVEHSRGGGTNPGNGGPACPRHNRFKNLGYRTVRTPNGGWRTFRPDGTEIGRPFRS